MLWNLAQPLKKPVPSHLKIINHLISNLFTAEDRRLKKALEILCKKNEEAYGKQLDGFLFQGDFYTPAGIAKHPKFKKVLHFSLNEEMSFYYSDFKCIERDKERIQQMLVKLVGKAETLQMMRDTLPDCLATMLPALNEYNRQGDVGCTLENQRDRDQLKQILPKIEMYSVTRLIY